jgi:hypothetical protein
MTNPLVYKPKIKKAGLLTGGVNTSPLGRRYGDEALAKGVTDIATATGALKNHLDGIDDTNAYNRMTSQLEVEMGKVLIDIESQNDPDTYSQQVGDAYNGIRDSIGSTYEFKTTKAGVAWKGFTEDSWAKYQKVADRKQANMRIDRALVGLQDNRKLAGQSAAMQQNHLDSQVELEGKLAELSKDAVESGLETAKSAYEADQKVLMDNDWYYAQEQIEADPQRFMDFMENEEAFFKKYKYLAPNQLAALRDLAENEIKHQDKLKKDQDTARKDEWHRRHSELRREEMNPENTPEQRANARKNRAKHLEGAIEAGIPPNYVDKHQDEIYNPKTTKPNPQAKGKYLMGINDGSMTDPDIWWAAAQRGEITYQQAVELDNHLDTNEKGKGKVSQWKKIEAIAEDVSNPMEFILTMEWVQREAGWANSDPRLITAAEKLKDTQVKTGEAVFGLWDTKEKIYSQAYADKPWDEGGKEWDFKAQFDPTIPSANPEEIKEVNEYYDKIVREQMEKQIGKENKVVLRNSPKNRQRILSLIRKSKRG